MKQFLPRELQKFQAADREQCGVLIETSKGIRIVEVFNAHGCPESYAIRLADYNTVESCLPKGEKIHGFFHTHLAHHNAKPSDDDLNGAALNPKLANCVYQPSTGIVTWYGNLAEVEI